MQCRRPLLVGSGRACELLELHPLQLGQRPQAAIPPAEFRPIRPRTGSVTHATSRPTGRHRSSARATNSRLGTAAESAKILCAGSPARGWVTLHLLLSGLDSGHLCEFKANLILVCQGLVKWCGHSDAARYSNFEELCEEADRNWLSKENIRFLNRVSQVRILLGALSASGQYCLHLHKQLQVTCPCLTPDARDTPVFTVR